ncbi:hemerythrin domain-containing protein [Streptomyces sp. NPDC002004]
MGHGGNVIAELTTDHREVEALFAKIEALPVGDERRRELADELTMELVRHSVAEEQYLYPAVREHLEGGDELADKEVADHEKVEELLKQLEGREADNPEFDHFVAKIKFEVADHVRDEEGRLFPMMEQACTPQMLEDLGEKVRQAKQTAPTRPHPAAPDSKILTRGIGLVDRARDMISGRGHHD